MRQLVPLSNGVAHSLAQVMAHFAGETRNSGLFHFVFVGMVRVN